MTTRRGSFILAALALILPNCVDDVPDSMVTTSEQPLVLPPGLIETTTITLTNGDADDCARRAQAAFRGSGLSCGH